MFTQYLLKEVLFTEIVAREQGDAECPVDQSWFPLDKRFIAKCQREAPQNNHHGEDEQGSFADGFGRGELKDDLQQHACHQHCCTDENISSIEVNASKYGDRDILGKLFHGALR